MNDKLVEKYQKVEKLNRQLETNPSKIIDEVLNLTKQYGYVKFKSPFSFLRYLTLWMSDNRNEDKNNLNELLKIGGKLSLVGIDGETWISDFPTDNWVVTEADDLPPKYDGEIEAIVGKDEFLQVVIEDSCPFFLVVNGTELFPCIDSPLIRRQLQEELEYALYHGFLKDIDNFYQVGRRLYIAIDVELKRQEDARYEI